MREMKDSGVKWIGVIPSFWELSKIGALYEERNVKVSDNEYQPLSVTKKGIVLQLQTAAKTDNGDNRKLIKKNDFVINSRSDRRGSCGISEYDGSCSLINIVLKPRKNIINAYYNYVFHSDLFADEFYAWGNGIVDDLWSTKWSKMKHICIPLPPLEEQKNIAFYLNEKCRRIDGIIEKQEQIIEKLRLYRESVIAEVVTKGCNSNVSIKDSGISWIGYIPCHWKVLKLRAHAQMLTPMRDKPEKLDGDIPWIRIEDYNGKYISESKEGLGVSKETIELMNLKVYPVNSILCTSSCDLGKCAIVAKELVSNQRFINIIPDKDTCSDYLYYLMLSNAKRLNHLSTGTIQANLSRVAFEHLLVQFPPKEEQEIIAHYLDKKCEAIDRQIDERQLLIARLKEYKRALIFECVTGKKEISARPNAFSNTGIKPAVLEQIRNLAKKYGIRKIILFGSRARGTFHRDSDIDLAVSGGNIDFFRLTVEEETDTLLAYDVVNLDRTSNEELLDVIRKEGVIIYEEV